jgi:hypothetical protein
VSPGSGNKLPDRTDGGDVREGELTFRAAPSRIESIGPPPARSSAILLAVRAAIATTSHAGRCRQVGEEPSEVPRLLGRSRTRAHRGYLAEGTPTPATAGLLRAVPHASARPYVRRDRYRHERLFVVQGRSMTHP